ncbi:TPA: DNA repair protein RecO [Candidatus Galligastranaerophilus gallistercoris]|nr:DNA repair protein RecO [Candidatus Galligastranaerophilus gallistercoris]
METFVTDAINIKTYPLSENDSIVVMFSKEMGLIRGIAKGAKNPKSKLGARMQSLIANRLMLNKKRNLDIIKEASAINPFNKLRYDLDKLTMAFYAAEIINTFCNDDDKDKTQNELIYNLLYKTLENIQNSKDKTQITLNILKFQLHFMNIAGFGIELERCLKCSKTVEGDALFSIQTGGIICPNCDVDQVQYVKLHKKIREFLITLSKTPVDKKTFYDDLVNDKITNSCFNLLKKYIEITCNKKSKALKVMEAAKVS